MMRDITKSKKQETEDIIKDLKNREALERAKMRLDCLSVLDDYEGFSFYYELLMSNQSDYIKTKSRDLLRKKMKLQVERFKNEKALETANEEETKKINNKIRAISREIGITSKRIAFLSTATFEELLKDFQEEYRHVRVNEIRNIEETEISNRDEVIFGVLNSPNGTQKLQSLSLKISELKRKLNDIKTRIILPQGSFPFLNQKLKETSLITDGTGVLNEEDLASLMRMVNKSENEYFKALVNLKYFDEDKIAHLVSLDATDFKEIRRLIPEYKEFISEDLQLSYIKTYRTYIDKNNKIFKNKTEVTELEKKLIRYAQLIFTSIRQNLICIYKDIESKFGYNKTIAPLSLEAIFELNGSLRKKTDEAYEYLTEVKAEIKSAKRRIEQVKSGLNSETLNAYQELSDISGVEVTEEIAPVKIPEFTSIYKKVYTKHVLNEIDQTVEEELAKHNVTQKGGIAITKNTGHKED